MKLSDHLSDKQKKQLEKLRLRLTKKKSSVVQNPPAEPAAKKKKENLSLRDLEDLMGKRRDTFKRVRGAVRRK